MARLGATFRATLSHIEVPGKAVNPTGVATYRAVPGPASGPISGTCLVPSYRAAVPYTAADSAIVTVRAGFSYIPGSGLPDYLVHQVPCTWSREIVHTGEDVQAENPSDATAGCLNPHTPAHESSTNSRPRSGTHQGMLKDPTQGLLPAKTFPRSSSVAILAQDIVPPSQCLRSGSTGKPSPCKR